VAGSAQQDFAAALRNAGNALQRIPESGPDAALAAALNEVIASLLALGKEGAATPAPAPEPAPAAPEPADDLSRWMASVPAAPVPPPAATPAPAPAPAPPPRAPEFHPAPAPVAADDAGIFAPSGWSSESTDLEGSLVTYQRLVRERPATSPSVDGFLASAPGVVATAPRAETPAPAPAAAPPAPAPVPVAAPAADAVVEIRSLCYAGRSALARASEVRSELLKVLAGQGGNLRPLLDELLDLVELAHQPDA
jgi:hypothetical protein